MKFPESRHGREGRDHEPRVTVSKKGIFVRKRSSRNYTVIVPLMLGIKRADVFRGPSFWARRTSSPKVNFFKTKFRLLSRLFWYNIR